jgi:hypothetical protein
MNKKKRKGWRESAYFNSRYLGGEGRRIMVQSHLGKSMRPYLKIKELEVCLKCESASCLAGMRL